MPTILNAWTDYPFTSLGDLPGKLAPVRQVEIRAYDNNKYCVVNIAGTLLEVKAGYLYQKAGRFGQVPAITLQQLATLECPDASLA